MDSLLAKSQGKPKNTGVGSLSLLHQIFPRIELGSPALQTDSLPTELWGKPLGSPCWKSIDNKLKCLFLDSQFYLSVEGIYLWEFPGGQWLGLCALTAKGMCSIPDWGTKIPEARSYSKKRKKRLPILTRWWLSGKEPAKQAADFNPCVGKIPWKRKWQPTALQYACLGNPIDWGAWRVTVHGVARVEHNLVTKQHRKCNFLNFTAAV